MAHIWEASYPGEISWSTEVKTGSIQSILDDGVMAFVGKPFEQAKLSEEVAQVLRG